MNNGFQVPESDKPEYNKQNVNVCKRYGVAIKIVSSVVVLCLLAVALMMDFVNSPQYKTSYKQELIDSLKVEIEYLQQQVPIAVDMGTTITHIEIFNGYVIYDCICDEEIIDMELVELYKDSTKKDIINSFDSELIDGFYRMEYGIIYNYTGDISGKTVSIEISPFDFWLHNSENLSEDERLEYVLKHFSFTGDSVKYSKTPLY